MAQAEIPASTQSAVTDFQRHYASLEHELAKVIVGQCDVIRQTLCCLLIGGHALIEGVPGIGKTLLARSLGQVLDLKFSRIQFTPDLMPADVTGTKVYDPDAKARVISVGSNRFVKVVADDRPDWGVTLDHFSLSATSTNIVRRGRVQLDQHLVLRDGARRRAGQRRPRGAPGR